jgi:hypothetical protein
MIIKSLLSVLHVTNNGDELVERMMEELSRIHETVRWSGRYFVFACSNDVGDPATVQICKSAAYLD